MAYADAFAAATAIAHGAIFLSGDPELLVPGAPWHFEDLRAERSQSTCEGQPGDDCGASRTPAQVTLTLPEAVDGSCTEPGTEPHGRLPRWRT